MVKKLKKVEPISFDEDGNMIINLSAYEGSDDWIRAGRLKQEGKIEEFNQMMNNPMYAEDEEE